MVNAVLVDLSLPIIYGVKHYQLYVMYLIEILTKIQIKNPTNFERKKTKFCKCLLIKVWRLLAKVNISVNKDRKIGSNAIDSVLIGNC